MLMQAELAEANSKLSAAEKRMQQVKNAADITKGRLEKEVKDLRAAVNTTKKTISSLNNEIEVCQQ